MRTIRSGATQQQALVKFALSPDGTAEVPAPTAAGLIANAFAAARARTPGGRSPLATCQITPDQGRSFVCAR